MRKIEILPYSEDLKKYFKSINMRWLEKYFEVEPIDLNLLDKPEEFILEKGGEIYFAAVDGEIAGTCALEKHGATEYELIKMGVDPKFQGLGLGKLLGNHTINMARALGATRLFLNSSRKLDTALELYKKLGFTEFVMDYSKSDYKRCDITMELIFSDELR
ncbi:MAG: putative acetyltransferase [Sphingobacteriales bacterium]